MFNLPLFLTVMMSFLIVVGCTSDIPVLDKIGDIEYQQIIGGNQIYKSPAWLSSQHIAYMLNRSKRDNNLLGELYGIEANSWQPILFEGIEGCVSTELDAWQRLPDGRLGFIYECRDAELSLSKIGHYLIAWAPESNEFEILKGYDKSLSPRTFAVTPDFTNVFQESSSGGNISHKLYQAALTNDDIDQHFSDFYRAGWPTISPTGETVAFAANESGPGSKTNIFTGYFSLSNEMFFPWNLYLMKADGTDVRIVLSDIVSIKNIKWSPAVENLIAFTGEYADKRGLWLYNQEMNNLTFLWATKAGIGYDWSPDGKQIILQDCIKGEDYEIGDSLLCVPTIINVPLE